MRLGHDFRLQFKGKQLEDGKVLRDYDVNPGSTVFIIGRLKGGPVKDLFELSLTLILTTASLSVKLKIFKNFSPLK